MSIMRDGKSAVNWQREESEKLNVETVSNDTPVKQEDKERARSLIGNVNNYADEHTGELSISAFGPLSTRIAVALATVRREAFKEAQGMMDMAQAGIMASAEFHKGFEAMRRLAKQILERAALEGE